MDNATAGKNNAVKQSSSTHRMMMTVFGRIFDGYRESGNTIYEVDAYGGILNTYILGVNCVAVLRHRTTTVQETYTLEG
jgi:hypothetical protein